MIYNKILAAVVLVASAYKIPLERRTGGEPRTASQKLLAEDRHKRLGSDNTYQDTLANNNNLAYTGTVFVGTPLQGNSAGVWVYDTGSGYLDVPAWNCTSCDDEIYNPDNSDTYQPSPVDVTELDYGSASLTG